jgi:hypothetical protein
MGHPVILVFGIVPHQRLVNDTRQEKQPSCVKIIFFLEEAPDMLRSVEQKLHMGSYRLQYAQLCILLTRQRCQRRDYRGKVTCLPSISPAIDLRVDRGISAGTDVLMSSRASNVSWEDCAMDIIEEEACRRSRYRSLHFHIGVPKIHLVQYTGTHPTISRSSSCLTSASVLSYAA